VNLALEETIRTGFFAHERAVIFDVVHRFNEAAELLAEVETWTGTTVPAPLRRRLERYLPSRCSRAPGSGDYPL